MKLLFCWKQRYIVLPLRKECYPAIYGDNDVETCRCNTEYCFDPKFSTDHFQVSFQSLQLGVEEPLDRIGLKACMTILQRKGRIFLIITLS